MKYFVYAIRSKVRNYTYIRLTNNVERRLTEHNSGKNKTTKPYRPFRLIYTEEFETRELARIKEKYLKTFTGRKILRKII